jgi:hypothetical protein
MKALSKRPHRQVPIEGSPVEMLKIKSAVYLHSQGGETSCTRFLFQHVVGVSCGSKRTSSYGGYHPCVKSFFALC